MRIFLVLGFVFFCFSCSGFGGGTTSCVFEATITLKDGAKQKGFFGIFNSFQLSIGQDTDERYYYVDFSKMYFRYKKNSKQNVLEILPTEFHFFNYVKRLVSDSQVEIFEQIGFAELVRKNQAVMTPVRLGTPITLSLTDISDIVVHKVHFVSNYWAESKCSIEDLSWINSKSSSSENLGGNPNCSYIAYYLGGNAIEAKPLVNRIKELLILTNLKDEYPFSKNDILVYEKEIDDTILKLTKLKILVTSYCAC